jgi:ATP-dependent Lhr-like helicase
VPLPDHPLIAQTVHDCLHEAMDVERWEELLAAIHSGKVQVEARDTREPSPFSHSILNANPYAFLDDAPLEERRARAVAVRRTLNVEELRDLAKLDPEAVDRVRAEAWPLARDAEELHDALLSMGVLPASEGFDWKGWFDQLAAQGRAAEVKVPGGISLWLAAERWPMVRAAYGISESVPPLKLPSSLEAAVEPGQAAAAIVRGRLEIRGPVTAEKLSRELGLNLGAVETALAQLEAEGVAMQGRFGSPQGKDWCERRLLARIHRLTLEGARKRVQPVPPERYWSFLAEHHHLLAGVRRDGPLGF